VEVGGFIIGLAKPNHLIRRIFTMGAHYAYHGEYVRSPLEWSRNGRFPAAALTHHGGATTS
jgi:hypothetical protein